jgi:hypothetical protein
MILCQLFHKWVSWHADANTELPGWARRHAQNCPACREFHDSMRVTVQALSVDAEGEQRQPPPFLQHKIMSAIRAGEGTASRPAPRRMAPVLAIGTACVLGLAVFLQLHRPMTPPEGTPASQPVAVALSLELPTAAQMDRWTTSLDAPLENEMQLVLGDAQAAVNALKQNLWPDNNPGASPRQN